MVCGETIVGERLGDCWIVGWGWVKPSHQMCALCDNEHHEGMRGVVGGGRVWGVLDRGREKSKVAGGIISPIPFLPRSASRSKHIHGTQSHQGCGEEGKIYARSRTQRDTESYKERK